MRQKKKTERVGIECGEKDEMGKKEIYLGDKLQQNHVLSSLSPQGQFRIDLGDRKF